MCITTEWVVVKPDELFRKMEKFFFSGTLRCSVMGHSLLSRTQAIEIAFCMLMHNFYDLKASIQQIATFIGYVSNLLRA